MESRSRVQNRIPFFLLILGNVATALSGLNLDCTNDYVDLMFCHFDAQNCEGYNLTLQSHYDNGMRHCNPTQCGMGPCCCTLDEMILVSGETHSATVWKGGKIMESKIISIRDSIKPRTPTITSVKESNGNFQILWKTNHEGFFSEDLTAEVIYHIKGDTQKVNKPVKPTTFEGQNYYEIPGEDLEPSKTYAVCVRSYTNRSDKFSDSSEEWEFTTPMAAYILPLVIIISLSVAAVIISITAYCCYVKVKTKWWDTVAKCPNPKIFIMHPSEQELLKPVPPTISSICVEPFVPDDSKPWSESLRDTSSGSPQQSSGISTGSSCLSYAQTEPADIIAGVQDALVKAFPNISPISPLTTISLNPEVNKDSGLFSPSYDPCGVRADDVSSGSSCFDNKTYSILIPSCSKEMTTNCSEVQTQADMLRDSTYHPCASDDVTCVDQQASACSLLTSPVVSSLIPMEMSYQQCTVDTGGDAEASSLSSTSSGTSTVASCDPVSRVETRCESFDEATKPHGKTEGEFVYDENPCYGSVPVGALSFPLVDDNYQSFQNLVEQPNILFSEERSGEEEPQLNKCPEETFTKMPQSFLGPAVPGFMNSFQGDQCPSELQRPFLPLIPAEQSMPVITDSGYQSV
uniref:uncharacterized protein LOC117266966 isoform X1 n=1 Tax=Epinephelus lanceolatus TaxID=310571 RepID=UPI0014467275|nr:uncharacterized protein LOC117266966 isoform X1 [Epinephelus lanceolatus]